MAFRGGLASRRDLQKDAKRDFPWSTFPSVWIMWLWLKMEHLPIEKKEDILRMFLSIYIQTISICNYQQHFTCECKRKAVCMFGPRPEFSHADILDQLLTAPLLTFKFKKKNTTIHRNALVHHQRLPFPSRKDRTMVFLLPWCGS